MATEKEKIVFGVDIETGKAVSSVASLKSELKSLENAINSGQLQGEAFTTAAKRAGELKDQIADTKALINAFNPEAKFQAFASVLGGVANGFAVVQGAAALLGEENEDLEKAILKTQAAISIATGVNGLLGMKDAFVILAQVIKSQVVSAFSSLGKAIKSTGIIALVASLAVLIYQWYEETKAVNDAAKAQEKLNKQVAEYSDKIKDLRIEGARGREKERLEILKHHNDQLRAVDAAVKEETYTVEQGELLKAQIRENHALANQEMIAKFAKEDSDKKIQAQIEEGEALLELAKAQGTETMTQKREQDGLELQLLKLKYEKGLLSHNEYTAAVKRNEIEFARFQSDLGKKEEERRLATLSAAGDGLRSIASLSEQGAAETKALGVASATIDTYVGATKAYAQGGVLGFASAAAIIAAGLANVAKIIAVPLPSNKTANTPIPSPPSVQGVSNNTNIAASQPISTTVLNVGDQRVYVLESDITNSQNNVKKIIRKATIR